MVVCRGASGLCPAHREQGGMELVPDQISHTGPQIPRACWVEGGHPQGASCRADRSHCGQPLCLIRLDRSRRGAWRQRVLAVLGMEVRGFSWWVGHLLGSHGPAIPQELVQVSFGGPFREGHHEDAQPRVQGTRRAMASAPQPLCLPPSTSECFWSPGVREGSTCAPGSAGALIGCFTHLGGSRRARIGAGSVSSKMACQRRAAYPSCAGFSSRAPHVVSVGIFILACPLHVLASYEASGWKTRNGPISAMSSGHLPVIPRNPFLQFRPLLHPSL